MKAKRKSSLKLVNTVKQIASAYMQCQLRKDITTLQKEKATYILFIDKVQKAFGSLDNVEKYVLNNTFFANKDKFWWTSLYSKTTFYRIRLDAINNFLDSFYAY